MKANHVAIQEDDEGEAEWIDRNVAEGQMPAQHLRNILESGSVPFELLLEIQREQYAALDLLWQGLSPKTQREMEAKLAPGWQELMALMAANRRTAKALIKRRHNNGY